MVKTWTLYRSRDKGGSGVEGVRPRGASQGLVCGVLIGISCVLCFSLRTLCPAGTGSTGTGALDARVCKTDSPSVWGPSRIAETF